MYWHSNFISAVRKKQWLTAATQDLYKQKPNTLSIHFSSLSKTYLWYCYKGTGIGTWISQWWTGILTLTDNIVSGSNPFSSTLPLKITIATFPPIKPGLAKDQTDLSSNSGELQFNRHAGVIRKNGESLKHHCGPDKVTPQAVPHLHPSSNRQRCQVKSTLTTHHIPETDLPGLVSSCHKDDAFRRMDSHRTHSVFHDLFNVIFTEDHAVQAVLVSRQHH